jgi:acetoin utilization deacetylase AcuC-like enzyme
MRLQPRAVQVLILDWDVHHGNGTEDIFYESNDVLYISTHQQGLWPYTGVWRAQ